MSAIADQLVTVGHSTYPLRELVSLLLRQEVRRLADVRMYPGSRRLPHFGREALSEGLLDAGIEYLHLRELGGRRQPDPDSPNGGWRNEQFRGYADHMASAEFAAGIERLEAAARERRTAMMCAEAPWWRCHRRLVSDALLVRGWQVLHVLPDGSLAAHELTDFAEVDGERITYPPAQGELLQ